MGFFESFSTPERNEVPQTGAYKVKEMPEVQQAGGLKLHELVQVEQGKNEAGADVVQDKLVRIPAGTALNVEKVFYSNKEGAPFGVVTFTYHNEYQSKDVALKGCVNMNYLEKQEVVGTTDALKNLREEIEKGRKV